MKKHKSITMLLAALLIGTMAQAQIQSMFSSKSPVRVGLGEIPAIRQVDCSVHSQEERPEFSPEAVTIWSENFGSNPTGNGWMNYGFRGTNTGSTPDTNGVWEYRGTSTLPASGTGSRGAYAAGSTAIQSPTRTNGFMIFDSDWLDNNGVAGAFGTGVLPADHRGMLVSPRIDLSAHDFVNLSFYQYYRRFGGPGGVQSATGTYVLISVDNGLTWRDTLALNSSLAVNSSTASNNFQRINISSYAGGEDSVKIAFLFHGEYYFWMIDDIAVEQVPRVDMSIIGTNFLPDTAANRFVEYGMIPDANKTPLIFQARVANIGTTVRNNVRLQVSVIDTTVPGTPLFTGTSALLNGLAPFTDTLLSISTAYTPTLKKFSRVTYSLSFDSTTLDSTANNTATRQFELTDSIFAVNVSIPATSLVFGTRNFNSNDILAANICEIVASDTVTSATARLANSGAFTSQAGGLIFFTLETSDATTGLPGGQAAVVLETDLYTLSAQDVSRGRVTIPFPATLGGSPQDRVVVPGDYWLVAHLFSNGGLNHISLLDDQTVTMPNFASMLYITTWYTNGNALRMSLNFGRVPRVPGASVADQEDMAWVVYPNPASDKLHVKYSTGRALGNTRMTLVDMAGRQVLREDARVTEPAGTLMLDLSGIPQGTYLLELRTESGLYQQRVMVQN